MFAQDVPVGTLSRNTLTRRSVATFLTSLIRSVLKYLFEENEGTFKTVKHNFSLCAQRRLLEGGRGISDQDIGCSKPF